MSLAHPLALLGLLTLPLLVLFYMWRAQHQRQVVPSLWLWEEALARFSHHPTRRLPLRDPLLILQLIAALVLTIVLAGPRLDRPAAMHRIVVLDGSIAMAASDMRPDRFAQAQRRVESMIAALGPGDTLSLILAGPRARFLGETPGSLDLAALVRRLGPPSGAADVSGAAALARGIAAAPGHGSPRVTFLAAAQTPPLPTNGLAVETVRFGGALDDQGVAALTARCPPNDDPCQAFARVRNTAPAPRAADLAVWADGQLLGRQTLHLPASGSLDLAFAVAPGTRTVKVALQGKDALPADDTAWALVPSPPHLRALLVSDSPAALLRALRAVPGLDVSTVSPENYRDDSFVGLDLLVLDGYVPDNPPPLPLLVVNPPQDNALIPVQATNVFLPVNSIDDADPLVAGLDLYGLATNGQSLQAPSWAHVAVGGTRGPLILHGVQDGARTAVLAFDAGHSAFAGDLAFPLLIARLVRWLVPTPPASVTLGAPVWLPPDVQAVRDPAGATLTSPLVDATTPGVYRVAAGSGGLLPGDPLFAVAPAAPGQTSQDTIRIPPWMPPAAGGTIPLALWPALILLALVALSGEWWFYARKT